MLISYTAPDGVTTKYINADQVVSFHQAPRQDSINFSTVFMSDKQVLELPAKPSTLAAKIETAHAASGVTAL